MRRQSSIGTARCEAATPNGSTKETDFGWRKRLPLSVLAAILGSVLLSGCQPIPPSYYDWLAAEDGYYDGYAPFVGGRFVNECRFREIAHPRDCRSQGGVALSFSGREMGGVRGIPGRGSGMTGHATSHASGGSSHGGHAGGGHGGHGGR